MNPQLAIVIPAFRVRFLERTLRSLAAQTDRRFHVYVGDDASPEPIEPIVKLFQERLPLTYHRFSENLGGRSLTRHWSRCIALSREPWVWLFSDDDMMEPDCVASYYRTLEATQGGFAVYRFNTLIMDENDRPLRLNPPHPETESGTQFLYFLLRGLRSCIAQEAIFSRAAYDRHGWVDFPLAWGTDNASQIVWAESKGLMRIDGARVRWRWSGQNISSTRERKLKMVKARAGMRYVEWVLERVNAVSDKDFPLPVGAFKPLAREHFKGCLLHERQTFGPLESLQISRFMSQTWGGSPTLNMFFFGKINLLAALSQARNLIRKSGTKTALFNPA
jgi:glycosyltransferase involved in cell wall biosynthesis